MGRKFLSRTEQERIKETIRSVEKNTSGEIVVMVVPDSGPYPAATIWGAASVSFPLAILLTPVTCAFFWFSPQNMWVFLSWFIALFAASFWPIQRTAAFRRLFVREREMENQVNDAARTHFFAQGLHRTRHENAVLIFICVFERMVCVLADRGVNAKIPQSDWQGIVDSITSGIRETRTAEAIVEGVTEVGKRLISHFPPKTDEKDELKNLFVEER